MELLVWIGAGISVIGLIGIVWSIFAVARARKAGLDDDALRARMSRILPINIGALLLSILGLLLVLVGVILT
ncbi:hypothetical protein EU803_04405 [Loktanella sp. IMCC34160]|uniref:hypothetical protein n=1 Tax=Loktanella sp. IMCC34160 TaxID=2510646 RepID=UPI00101BB3CE|nr:hypothetical protein [Loktanella sp. IMCC34160]RYG91710.1 hypothetical protein EU803_04405 [Loktanella sp. IMCC34160]